MHAQLKEGYTYKAGAVIGGVVFKGMGQLVAYLKRGVRVYAVDDKGAASEVTRDNWVDFALLNKPAKRSVAGEV
jgi:hypothetical protein